MPGQPTQPRPVDGLAGLAHATQERRGARSHSGYREQAEAVSVTYPEAKIY